MKKIISLALFGADHAKYGQYLPAFVRAHLNLFQLTEDWRLVVHVDAVVAESRYGQLLAQLDRAELLTLRQMQAAPLTQAMLWRVAPVFDSPTPDYVFCRDLDACPMPRDRAICDQFIASGCIVHTAHDNVAHAGIMGGLSGFHAPALIEATGWHSLGDLYAAANQSAEVWALHGSDQNALNRLLDRAGGPRLLEHRFNGWTEGRPTPNARGASGYATEAFSAPLPNEGVTTLPALVRDQADRLANHLGSAGYDHRAAVQFWDAYGDPHVTVAVRLAEEAARSIT